MSALLLVALAVAGGLGAGLRFVVDGLVRSRFGGRFPVGTVLINLTGSLLLGLLTGLAASAVLPDAVRLVAGTGFLGGYTTFSTASFETVRLAQERRWTASIANAVGTVAGAVALAAAGFALGRAL